MIKRNYCIIPLILILLFAGSFTGCCSIFNNLSSISSGLFDSNGTVGIPVSLSSDCGPETSPEIKEPLTLKIFIDPAIPPYTRNLLESFLRKSISEYNEGASPGSGNAMIEGYEAASQKEDAGIIFEFVSAKDYPNPLGPIYFAPVVSFYSLIEEISWADLKSYWEGEIETVKDIEGNEILLSLAVSRETLASLTAILGRCNAKNLSVRESSDIRAAVTGGTDVLSIVPFERIEKEYKVLSIGKKSVLDKNTDARQYPLAGSVSVKVAGDLAGSDFEMILGSVLDYRLLSNRSTDDMVSILMTGVTALTRQVADRMDKNGILYPAEKIRDTLLDADITHISNEVSFVEDCYAARPNTLVFCSKPEYMQLLKYIDTDVLELTGNHVNDYGSKWFEYTLDIYDKEGIDYFGGGKNLEDAKKPATFEIGNYKFAFLGANSFGPSSAWATADRAGSAPINTLDAALQEKDMKEYEEQIKLLKSQGYNVIFTFQYLETYNYAPTGQQVKDFERMSQAGAVIVSGSQAHQPQGFEITENGFINFGLGNLFFGQAAGLNVKQGLLAKHIFYKGKHINTVISTTYIEDLSQPRLTQGSERADLLKAVFKGSIIKDVKDSAQTLE